MANIPRAAPPESRPEAPEEAYMKESDAKKKLKGGKKLHGVTIKVKCEGEKHPIILGGGDKSSHVLIRMDKDGPICEDEEKLIREDIIEPKRSCTCFTEKIVDHSETTTNPSSDEGTSASGSAHSSSPDQAITFQRITEELNKLENENDKRCMRYCYSLLQRAKEQRKNDEKKLNPGKELHGVTINVFCEGQEKPVTLSGGNAHCVNIAMGHDGKPVCENEEVLVSKNVIKSNRLTDCSIHAITYQRIEEEMEKLENTNDILCMRYCYSLLLRAEEQVMLLTTL
ncbi:uncharacterized protein [Ptychodera flava]|uniref:uncharacterized protein n=1 Tax=Ptychodera flava TaxID=63121 RepID=UPI00396A41A5